MTKLKYLVIHCTDTPYGRPVSADDIALWHKGAKKNADGTFTFLSKQYTVDQLRNSSLRLPSGAMVPASKTNGRGWDRCGYADLIQYSGVLLNITPYDFDSVISPWELTNGATGYNASGRHVVLAGGWSTTGDKDGKNSEGKLYNPTELYSKEQLECLKQYIKAQKLQYPGLTILGHNECAQKTCPNFDVQKWLKENGLI